MMRVIREFIHECVEEQKFWNKKRAEEPFDWNAATILLAGPLAMAIAMLVLLLKKALLS